MEILWYALLGLFLAGYLVLGGYDYGVGLLLAATPGENPRRKALTALGPFFLGNEVWLVAAVGILFGAFPMLEGELLSGLYPAVAAALAGVILVTAAVQLRSRPSGAAARARWDGLIIAGSALAALGWGAVLAGLLQGVPLHSDGHIDGVGHLFTPFVAAGGLTLVGLVAVHGAVFLTLRLPGAAGERYARLGRRLVPVALVALASATVLGLLTDRVRETAQQPVAALLLPVLLAVALLAAGRGLARRRAGLAFVASSAALALPVLLVAATTWPHALISTVDPAASLTVTDAAASTPTLRLLSWLLIPLIPALLGFQAMSWWVFRGRIDNRAPVYW
ncbi:cytochrome d ubiquinol oxidase subunit II [Micromonospora sp. NBC_01796]|uniref:cytochrome d ubiquinol oxidase subunit II n=1 Tax=Micromonospora sp. NBC_01796 TaxID=2975987 RepID=UPI002DD8CBEC|nr:cytochrome d ubiquinol oxidase subunit II [Micromonospora sp. NBC_01796]WSA89230.1 cytochrome d ubiquinol oxidase subunit II [Micromonospora sp. NBC_01796]